ncbi:MAG: GH39 [uncultured Thermomicrobiales bacterium]|uniref:GH39 n=1 Tax=uncultured Thermomicrobiales bacterium TaxID=1645740 RepID=A0A6J4UVM9_9BACT|nr:MAG: GH39 [uncultured Thermomicrobiales bacterium]
MGSGTWRAGRIFLAMIVLLVALAETATVGTGESRAAAPRDARRFGLVADIGTRLSAELSPNGPVALAAGSGAGWVKEEFRWDSVQPSRDQWTWVLMDRAVNAEREKGLEILGLLDFTAGWAVGEGREVSNTPPPHDLWANYVAQTVGRYKDRVHVWEVWNEPNVPVFWSGTKEQYAALLSVTYDTIKRVDPGATVLGPAISGIDEEWLAAMPWDKFDALALHVYVPSSSLDDQGYSFYNQGLPQMKQALARFPRKDIWITEFGFSSQGGPDPWNVGEEGDQARYLVQQAVQMLAYPDLPIVRIMPLCLH